MYLKITLAYELSSAATSIYNEFLYKFLLENNLHITVRIK
jgi:hypothetical protein